MGLRPQPGAADEQGRRHPGRFWNYEGVQLRLLADRRPRVIPVDKAGVPTYDELVFVANEDALERDEDKIRAFIGAVSRCQAVREDQDKGLDGLLDANPDPDPKLQRESVQITVPLFFPPRASRSATRTRGSGTSSRPGCGRTS